MNHTTLRSQSISTRKSFCKAVAEIGYIGQISFLTRKIHLVLFGTEVIDRDNLSKKDLKKLLTAEKDIQNLLSSNGIDGYTYWVTRQISKKVRKQVTKIFFDKGFKDIKSFTKQVYLDTFGVDIINRDSLNTLALAQLMWAEKEAIEKLVK